MLDDGIQVRPFAKGDGAALQGIYRECRAEATWLPSAARAHADFLSDTEGETLFVAVGVDGEPRGFISVWEPEAFIHHLYVKPDCRGKGVGGLLLDFLAGRIPMPWKLKCLRTNANAMAFYLERGWIEIGSGSGEEGPFALMERLSK